ncbi:hypothetical protein BOTBODRAFT_470041 [Botryobasidium botryosum FD-172 SS1]|uniref:Uncharacterized protein n=1 Tax=Botryobasidium botryosum (strain FD-172 SS1) TaxID=930990 RepID=A0A067MHH1_BOTB1|nr:hypothetical protein BOTBODRAFT_470041 [Botryobasidium botryosum FD-172 SS1]
MTGTGTATARHHSRCLAWPRAADARHGRAISDAAKGSAGTAWTPPPRLNTTLPPSKLRSFLVLGWHFLICLVVVLRSIPTPWPDPNSRSQTRK